MHNQSRLFNIIMAFQQFEGKSLKSLEAADVLGDDQLDVIEGALLGLAKQLKSISLEATYEEEMSRMAQKIEGWIRHR